MVREILRPLPHGVPPLDLLVRDYLGLKMPLEQRRPGRKAGRPARQGRKATTKP